jgi:hypothetical protein
MVFTVACQNFKKGLKMGFGPLGVHTVRIQWFCTREPIDLYGYFN